ncbi:putative formin, FH2 domain-containing protein [Helianthus annuus]|nr:putative formin, FH2 domain-containing protein [Helianthus annuus]
MIQTVKLKMMTTPTKIASQMMIMIISILFVRYVIMVASFTCCGERCFRSFHATPDSEEAQESNCESLCLSLEELEVSSAVGFKLDSLLKLTDTRASNSKMTLMHYLCKVLASKSPDLLDFHVDLVSLESATKIQLKSLAKEMQAILKGLEKVKQELGASANDGPVSEVFNKGSQARKFLAFYRG